MDLYDVALEVTNEVLGEGTYEQLNAHHPDPGVQAAIARAARGLADYPAPEDTVPCAYCGRMTPPAEQAAPAWLWPERGWVTNCHECAGTGLDL